LRVDRRQCWVTLDLFPPQPGEGQGGVLSGPAYPEVQ
jgi:hypothetical protein